MTLIMEMTLLNESELQAMSCKSLDLEARLRLCYMLKADAQRIVQLAQSEKKPSLNHVVELLGGRNQLSESQIAVLKDYFK